MLLNSIIYYYCFEVLKSTWVGDKLSNDIKNHITLPFISLCSEGLVDPLVTHPVQSWARATLVATIWRRFKAQKWSPINTVTTECYVETSFWLQGANVVCGLACHRSIYTLSRLWHKAQLWSCGDAGGVRMEDMVGLEVDWPRLAGSRLTGPLQPLHAQLFQQRPVFLPTEAEYLPPSEINLNQGQTQLKHSFSFRLFKKKK